MNVFILAFFLTLTGAHAADELVSHQWYTLSYNEPHEVANWVSYELEGRQLRNCVSRGSGFKPDPLVSTGSAVSSDYDGFGFDRGHLVPAGDMKFDGQAMRESFLMSNVAPQPPEFNRGKWAQLETLVRAWARKHGKLWIVTGPILRHGLPVIGRTNSVSVPEEYYKVILRRDRKGAKGVAFLMHVDLPYPALSAYAVTIDAVERLSGIDFFQFLENREEAQVEATYEPLDWDFNARFEYLPCEASVVR